MTKSPSVDKKVKIGKWEDFVCVYCGIDVNAPTCPKCKRSTELNPGSYGMQNETEL
jgi:hypothetical protein